MKLFFFEFGNPKVTVHQCAETIQGRKLYEEIRYKRSEFITGKLQAYGLGKNIFDTALTFENPLKQCAFQWHKVVLSP